MINFGDINGVDKNGDTSNKRGNSKPRRKKKSANSGDKKLYPRKGSPEFSRGSDV